MRRLKIPDINMPRRVKSQFEEVGKEKNRIGSVFKKKKKKKSIPSLCGRDLHLRRNQLREQVFR